MSGALFNEIEPYAVAWLRNLIAAGHIAAGDVDERSVVDLRPADLAGRTQVHLFAGIGVWSHALRLAGWPDDRPVWTASFPCQPFSAAGKRRGTDDERHLWPVGFELIRACRPPVILGEQVSSKDGLGWWDAVCDDLEGAGYACRALDLSGPVVGAPHIRQRLYWVAYAHDAGLEGRGEPGRERAAERATRAGGVAGGLGHSERIGAGRDAGAGAGAEGRAAVRAVGDDAGPSGAARGLADAGCERCDRLDPLLREAAPGRQSADFPEASGGGPTNGFWRDADWLGCRDGKWRPVEPGTFPLVDGAPARVGCVCAACVQAHPKGANDEVLRAVREVLGSSAGSLAPEVLRQGLYGRGLHQAADHEGGRSLSGAAHVRGQGMRGLREDGPVPPSPSQGREPDKQRAGEHRDLVRGVPLEGARETSRCETCGGDSDWLTDAEFRDSRTGRLRAYGNAIIAPLAAEFVAAVMETIDASAGHTAREDAA